MKNKTILIAAGGTGGHVFPGIAIAHEFERRGYSIEWLGTKKGLESRLVPVNGIKLSFFPAHGIRGRGVLPVLLAPFRLANSVFKAWRLLGRIQPSLVVGMGGFVSGPVGAAAVLKSIPLVIHEQNAVPGSTNRVLARLAKKVFTAFPVSLSKAKVIGNPVRDSLEELHQFERHIADKNKINVLVLGGSRGARVLNTLLPKALVVAELSEQVCIRHQCGQGREKEARDAYGAENLDVDILSFIDDMDEMMKWADIMICRAGALTVSEIAVVGLPSILIPYPYAIDDHQTANAQYLEQAGAAIIVQEYEFDSGKLVDVMKKIFSDRGELLIMAESAKLAAKLGATKILVDDCEGLIL